MDPLTGYDFDLECDLWRNFEAAADYAEMQSEWLDGSHWSDEQDAELCEREAMELAAGARMRPLWEGV